jgi:integrase
VAALYTTRRKGAILNAALGPAVGRPWVDLDRGIFYGRSTKKKRQPTITVPPRLLGHLRRWKKIGQRNLIEYGFEAICSIDKAFTANVKAANFGPDITPHTLRHTGITWLAIEGNDPYEICHYAGITMDVFEKVYAHHHPDYMTGIRAGFKKHRYRVRTKADGEAVSQRVDGVSVGPDRLTETKQEHATSMVTKIA